MASLSGPNSTPGFDFRSSSHSGIMLPKELAYGELIELGKNRPLDRVAIDIRRLVEDRHLLTSSEENQAIIALLQSVVDQRPGYRMIGLQTKHTLYEFKPNYRNVLRLIAQSHFIRDENLLTPKRGFVIFRSTGGGSPYQKDAINDVSAQARAWLDSNKDKDLKCLTLDYNQIRNLRAAPDEVNHFHRFIFIGHWEEREQPVPWNIKRDIHVITHQGGLASSPNTLREDARATEQKVNDFINSRHLKVLHYLQDYKYGEQPGDDTKRKSTQFMVVLAIEEDITQGVLKPKYLCNIRFSYGGDGLSEDSFRWMEDEPRACVRRNTGMRLFDFANIFEYGKHPEFGGSPSGRSIFGGLFIEDNTSLNQPGDFRVWMNPSISAEFHKPVLEDFAAQGMVWAVRKEIQRQRPDAEIAIAKWQYDWGPVLEDRHPGGRHLGIDYIR